MLPSLPGDVLASGQLSRPLLSSPPHFHFVPLLFSKPGSGRRRISGGELKERSGHSCPCAAEAIASIGLMDGAGPESSIVNCWPFKINFSIHISPNMDFHVLNFSSIFFCILVFLSFQNTFLCLSLFFIFYFTLQPLVLQGIVASVVVICV